MHKLLGLIFSHRKAILISTTILSFLYFMWGINAWTFSYVGDVWACYEYAKYIIEKNFLIYPFSFSGVFKENSALASFYQALFMYIFGDSNFSWRLSSISLIIPLSFFFYKWINITFDWKTALLSTILLQFSFYLCTFFKVGYYTPLALVLFSAVLYFAALSRAHPTKRNGCILGCILGFSFYVYVGPIFPLLIWPYFLPLLRGKNKRKIINYFMILITTYALWILMLLPNLHSITGAQSKTVLHKEFEGNTQIITNIGNNLLVFYKEFPIIATHFIPFSYLDIITQLFAFIGTIIVISAIRVKRMRDFLLVYLSTVIVLGITNPYTNPPISRGIFLVIFGVIFASIGLLQATQIKLLQIKSIIPILCGIILLNIYQSHYGNFNRTGYTGMALIMKHMNIAHTRKNKDLVLLITPYLNINLYLRDIQVMKNAYRLSDVRFSIVRPDGITCDAIANKKVLVFAYDTETISWLKSYNCDMNNISILTTPITYY